MRKYHYRVGSTATASSRGGLLSSDFGIGCGTNRVQCYRTLRVYLRSVRHFYRKHQHCHKLPHFKSPRASRVASEKVRTMRCILADDREERPIKVAIANIIY